MTDDWGVSAPKFTDAAKQAMEWNAMKELVNWFLAEQNLHFKDVDENLLAWLGMNSTNIEKCMRVIADKLIEMYGIKKRELKNEKQIKRFWVWENHLKIMHKYINVDQAIYDFARRINWERKEVEGQMVGSEPAQVRDDYEQNIVDVKDSIVNSKLIGIYSKALDRVNNLLLTESDEEVKKSLEDEKKMYQKKIQDLKSNKPTDG
jgi:hypothetical protein